MVNIKINWKSILFGISIPVVFAVICEIGELIESIFINVTLFVDMITFATFLLVFLASILVCLSYKTNMMDGLITGTLIGFIAEIMTLIVIIISGIIIQFLITHSSVNIVTDDFICYYVVPNLVFQSIIGGMGGIIGVMISKHIKNS